MYHQCQHLERKHHHPMSVVFHPKRCTAHLCPSELQACGKKLYGIRSWQWREQASIMTSPLKESRARGWSNWGGGKEEKDQIFLVETCQTYRKSSPNDPMGVSKGGRGNGMIPFLCRFVREISTNWQKITIYGQMTEQVWSWAYITKAHLSG